ncbi:MAG: formyltransferase [Pseudomonadota bacterium]
MTRAVVFAYHQVGVRCLATLLAHGIEVALVVTHEDQAGENIWFDSVADLAARYAIPSITPDDPNSAELSAQIAALQPDFLFSFYYRKMLKPELLTLAKKGAYNLHGSLLPKYRGRVPINWALVHGETITGATLHAMLSKPDAGPIVSSSSVPILPDDTAFEVFNKLTVAAEIALDSALPDLLAGRAEHHAQDLTQGSYFGGRTPEDGRIDWAQSGAQIHNLIRAVAPPYPGAFFELSGTRFVVLRSLRQTQRVPRSKEAGIYCAPNAQGVAAYYVDCADQSVLQLLGLAEQGRTIAVTEFITRFGTHKIPLKLA